MAVSADLSSEVTSILVLAPADTTATATLAAGLDTSNWKRAKVVVNLAGISGGGSWTLSLTSSATLGGTYTAETSADVFVGGAPTALETADAGVIEYDILVENLDRRFIKTVLTKAGTISASLISATIEAELARY